MSFSRTTAMKIVTKETPLVLFTRKFAILMLKYIVCHEFEDILSPKFDFVIAGDNPQGSNFKYFYTALEELRYLHNI